MGFNIGSIVSDIGSAFKSFDIGNIGKTVLDEGKKLLGDVVKDTFQLSSQPGKTFDENLDLNILGNNIQLPNPVDALANKLLGKANDFLNQYGVNVDFKTALGKLFNLTTQSADGTATSTTVPSLRDRALAGDVPGAAAVGGGAAQVTASAATAGANAVGGASAVSTTVAPSVSQAPALNGGSADSGLVNALASEDGSLNSLINSISDDMSAADLAKVQAKIQQAQQMISTLSNILKEEGDMRNNIIRNIAG